MSIVKDEGYNLNAMTNVLKFVVSCEYLWLEERFKELVLVMFFQRHVNMAQ